MIGFAVDLEPIAHPVARQLRGLFSTGTRVAFAEPFDTVDQLFPEEESHIRRAVPSRRREYALGRMCARRALADMGAPVGALPTGADRAPVWPPGSVGSITHCEGFVGAAVARLDRVRCLGFDVEPATPLARALVPLICTPSELAWMHDADPLPAADWAKVLFSAKEAVHKCVFPLTGIMLDFTDVTLSVDRRRGSFAVHLEHHDPRVGPTLLQVAGHVATDEQFVFTSAIIE